MARRYAPVVGMELLVPLCAGLIGLAVAVVVRRHARRRGLSHPRLWAVVVGLTFVAGPVLLRPTLRPLYVHTFVPILAECHSSRLLIKPIDPAGALLTYLIGGSTVGVSALACYLWYCCRVTYRRAQNA